MSGLSTLIVFLRSRRVVLRPVLKEDLPLFIRWINDPDVSQFLNVFFPMMEADEQEWFDSLPKRKSTDIVFVIVVDGKAIGTMGIHNINWKNRTAITGAFIGEKDYWGKGLGSEAKMILLDYAFNTLNLRKICSTVIAFNERSYRYSLKCGYKEEGRLKEHHFKHGTYWDEILLAVFRDDWLPLWEAFAKEQGISES